MDQQHKAMKVETFQTVLLVEQHVPEKVEGIDLTYECQAKRPIHTEQPDLQLVLFRVEA